VAHGEAAHGEKLPILVPGPGTRTALAREVEVEVATVRVARLVNRARSHDREDGLVAPRG
jgi:hypothetical protein